MTSRRSQIGNAPQSGIVYLLHMSRWLLPCKNGAILRTPHFHPYIEVFFISKLTFSSVRGKALREQIQLIGQTRSQNNLFTQKSIQTHRLTH